MTIITGKKWNNAVGVMAENSYCIGKHRSALLLCPPFFVFYISRWCCFTTVGVRFLSSVHFLCAKPNCISHSLAHINIRHTYYCVFLPSKITRFSDVYRSVFCLCSYYLPVVESYVYVWLNEKRVKERDTESRTCFHANLYRCPFKPTMSRCLCVFGRESYLIFS